MQASCPWRRLLSVKTSVRRWRRAGGRRQLGFRTRDEIIGTNSTGTAGGLGNITNTPASIHLPDNQSPNHSRATIKHNGAASYAVAKASIPKNWQGGGNEGIKLSERYMALLLLDWSRIGIQWSSGIDPFNKDGRKCMNCSWVLGVERYNARSSNGSMRKVNKFNLMLFCLIIEI